MLIEGRSLLLFIYEGYRMARSPPCVVGMLTGKTPKMDLGMMEIVAKPIRQILSTCKISAVARAACSVLVQNYL